MPSNALLSYIDNGQKIGFSLPAACPVKSFPSYATFTDATTEDMMTGQNGTETIVEDVSMDPQEAPPIDNEILT